MIVAANKPRHSDGLHSGKSGETHPGNNKGKQTPKGDGEADANAHPEANTTGKTSSSK